MARTIVVAGRPACPKCGSLTPAKKNGATGWATYCSRTCRSRHEYRLARLPASAAGLRPPCEVRGCDVVSQGGVAGGLCTRHYKYLKRTGVAASKPELRAWFYEDLIASSTVECVVWPFGTGAGGYGKHHAVVDGVSIAYPAHRYALMLLTGTDPKDKLACHGPCNNKLCVNPHPEHGMRWGSRADNVADMVRDGTKPQGEAFGQSVLTERKVREAHARYASGEVVSRIADDLGVSGSTIVMIAQGKRWMHLGLPALSSRYAAGTFRRVRND